MRMIDFLWCYEPIRLDIPGWMADIFEAQFFKGSRRDMPGADFKEYWTSVMRSRTPVADRSWTLADQVAQESRRCTKADTEKALKRFYEITNNLDGRVWG